MVGRKRRLRDRLKPAKKAEKKPDGARSLENAELLEMLTDEEDELDVDAIARDLNCAQQKAWHEFEDENR